MFFCDICRHFEASIGFFFSKVVNLVKFIILAPFATFVRGVLRTKHTLVSSCIKFYFNSFNWHTPCYSCDFCGICRHFGVSIAFFFSTILYIRHFSHFGVLASMKNSCYFCEICGHFGVPFGFFFSIVVNLVISVILEIFVRGTFASEKNPCYFCDFCDICGHFKALFSFFFS